MGAHAAFGAWCSRRVPPQVVGVGVLNVLRGRAKSVDGPASDHWGRASEGVEAKPVRRIVAVLLAGLVLACLGLPEIRQSAQRDPVKPTVTRLSFAPLTHQTPSAPRSVDESAATHTDHVIQPKADAPPPRVAARLTRGSTAHFGLVALTWRGESHDLHAHVRVREQGRWQPWHSLHPSEDAPDAGSPDAARVGQRWGTDPLLTSGSSEGVDVIVTTRGGVRPKDLHVLLIDGKRTTDDISATSTAAARNPFSNAAWADPQAPTIVSRAGWGADETLKSGQPQYSSTIKIGFVHHTVTASAYPQSQAAAQVRAVYAYDTLGLGISDMGYNYLVDRFGTIYEGRAGGIDKAVVGAHTAGFNENSFAVAVLGDFHNKRPTSSTLSSVVNSVGAVAGWKLGLFHRDPMAPVSLVSGGKYGTSRYEAGQVAKMPHTLIGHGDIGATACPGKYLRTQLNLIRQVARASQSPAIWSPQFTPSTWSWSSEAGTTVRATTSDRMDITARIFSPCAPEPVRVLSAKQTKAGDVSITWNGRDDGGNTVPPGRYTIQLSGVTDSGAVPWSTSDVVDIDATATSPLGPCDDIWRIADVGSVVQSVAAMADATAKTMVVASSATDELANAVTAAVMARKLKARLVLADESGLPAASAATLDAGTITRAIVIASTGKLSAAVTALSNRGISVIERVSGATPAAVSIAVLRKGWTKTTSVIAVPVGSTAGVLAAAGAYATNRGLPLLLIAAPKSVPQPTVSAGPSGTASSQSSTPPTTSGPSGGSTTSGSTGATPTGSANSASASSSTTASGSATSATPSASSTPTLAPDLTAALREVGATATVLVGTTALLSPPSFGLLPKPTKVSGNSTASVSLALAKKYKTPVSNVVISNDASAGRGYAVIAALTARPVLLMTTTVWNGTASWLSSAAVKKVALLGSRSAVSPDLVPSILAAVSPSPQPSPSDSTSDSATASPSQSSVSASPTSGIPIAFAVNGAGFGHGIGMPQYGAQAQAIAGRTAKEIVEYYYTGSKVKAVDDTAIIRVNVLHQVSSATFRARGVDSSPSRTSDDPGAALDLTSGEQSSLSAAGDTFTATATTTKSGARLTLQRTDVRGRTTVMGTYSSVLLRWGGTRDPGSAGSNPAYIDIAGPTEGLGDGYGRYRYGTMTISAVTYTSGGKAKAGIEAVNAVRIHDEYLRGIGEVPASWKPAALQAQIIASRGYAISALRGGVKSGCDCNVYDSDQSQVFAGWMREVGYTAAAGLTAQRAPAAVSGSANSQSSSPSATGTKPSASSSSGSASGSGSPSGSATASASASGSPSGSGSSSPSASPTKPVTELPLPDYALGRAWVKAVLATSPNTITGLAATVNGSVIASYFYSTSAGRTENSEDVWTMRLSWARSVPDPWSLDSAVVPARLRSWQTVVSQADASAFFGLRDIVRIDVTSRTAGGAARTLTATSYRGATATGNAVSFRKQFDLKSRWLSSVAPYGGWSQPVTRTPSPSPSGSGSSSASSSVSSSTSVKPSTSPTSSATASPSSSASASSSQPPANSAAIAVVNPPATAVANNTVAFSVKVRRPPVSAVVVIARRTGSQWRAVSQARIRKSGTWTLIAKLPAGSSTLRAEIRRRGAVVVASSTWKVNVVGAPSISAKAPTRAKSGTLFEIQGIVKAAPKGARVQRQLNVNGTWQPRGAVVALTSTSWQMSLRAPNSKGRLTYRVLLLDSAGKVIARSRALTVDVR